MHSNLKNTNHTDDINLVCLQQLSTWIAMAYPTWLIFFDDKAKFSDFFFNIYVPFDCKLMIARKSTDDRDSEIITEVYQIDREKELRSMQFGIWHMKRGLKGPTRGLFLRRNNLFGHNIRVTSVHVRSLISLFHKNSLFLQENLHDSR